jgi:putative methyltransferase (TIGR04325 family)
MNSNLKLFLNDWLPPIIFNKLQSIKSGRTKFSKEYFSWDLALIACSGYNDDSIKKKVLEATLKVNRGEAVYERDSVLFDEIEYSWELLFGLMWATIVNDGRLSVLDFGGGFGSSYFQNKKLLKNVKYLTWSIVEQDNFVKDGRKYIQDDNLFFFNSIDDSVSSSRPSLILLSSVLQYLPNFLTELDLLINIGADLIVIDRTIINSSYSSKIYIQHVPKSIYRADYPCWSISESILLERLSEKYQLLSSFDSLEFSELLSIDSMFKGYIFYRRA